MRPQLCSRGFYNLYSIQHLLPQISVKEESPPNNVYRKQKDKKGSKGTEKGPLFQDVHVW